MKKTYLEVLDERLVGARARVAAAEWSFKKASEIVEAIEKGETVVFQDVEIPLNEAIKHKEQRRGELIASQAELAVLNGQRAELISRRIIH